jgi:hypothetical protein
MKVAYNHAQFFTALITSKMKFNTINLKFKNIDSRNYQVERTDFNKFNTLKEVVEEVIII